MKLVFPVFVIVAACVLISGRSTANELLVSSLPEMYMPEIGNFMETALIGAVDVENRSLIDRENLGRVKVGDSLKLPDVSLNFIYRMEDDISKVGSNVKDRQIADFSVDQPLFHWGVLAADKKMFRMQYEISQLQTRQTMKFLAKDTRSLLMNLCLQKTSLEQVKVGHEANLESLSLLRQRFESGIESEQVLETKEIELERSRLHLDQVTRNLDYYLDSLERRFRLPRESIMEGAPSRIPKVEILSEGVLASLEQLVTVAISANENIKLNEIYMEISNQHLHKADKRLYPKISVTTGITQNERDINGRLTEEELLYAGVNVDWNIFDGFETAGLKEVALVGLELSRKTSSEYRSWFKEEFRRMVHSLRREASYLRIDEKLLLRYEKELEDAKGRFGDGTISTVDLANAERSFEARLLGVEHARVRYLNSLTSLVSTIGLDPFVLNTADSPTSRSKE